ncbi:unnamed protein product [Periconia digitata]|uniref:Uncharacterized protein n=1 Tax=Periconia digitata TaxID=1303443 RepID=A0A9W4UMC5_9PLEO|nr:unnamed protein product [Periconia digitata]
METAKTQTNKEICCASERDLENRLCLLWYDLTFYCLSSYPTFPTMLEYPVVRDLIFLSLFFFIYHFEYTCIRLNLCLL